MEGNVLTRLLGGIKLDRRSLGFFFLLLLLAVAGWLFYQTRLNADEPVSSSGDSTNQNAVQMSLNSDGNLYVGKTRLNAEVFNSDTTYRYRYQVVNQPKDFIEEIIIDVTLPRPGTEQTVGYNFINNGGAQTATSQLIDPQTVEFDATGVSSTAQLSIELEVPKAFVNRSAVFLFKQKLANLPAYVWAGISIVLPSITLLLLLAVALGRIRKVEPIKEKMEGLPSRLPPAMVGILLRGRLNSRDLAATFLSLATRGHLIIRQRTSEDYRFRRGTGVDTLADFEQVLLDQIFGANSEHASSEEITFSIAQEVFSRRVSQSFILAYQQMNNLGYFYTNPLALHRRYQSISILLFIVGLLGLAANTLLFGGVAYALLFWLGMLVASLLVFYFSKGLPMRTIYGDRELARWLAFGRYLSSTEPANYAAQSQEKYLAYLPYAVVLEVEQEWTARFYDLPFSQPNWYVAANIATIDQFANSVFPLLGYLSHALALTVQPVAR